MAADWQIGDRIQNRWEIHKILTGGMGIVYIVYDHELREPFAAKTFQDEVFARSPAVADRFTQEARTWINLDLHQNITGGRFVLNVEGKPYLFLEYISGGDLSGWINTPRLTEDLPQVLRFAIQFCDGMSHAVAKGVTAHRDIKPANCLVTQDGTLKVTDFGLAKAFDDAVIAQAVEPQMHSLSINLTRTGQGAGTPPYMAPEQFGDAKHVDMRADIYSFGVMLYEMITGRLPFVGRSWEGLKQLHLSQPAPTLGRVSDELSEIVQRCLAKEPERRYGGFVEVRERLAAEYKRVTGGDAPEAVRGAALNAEQLSNKGVSLSELGRSEGALAYFDSALALNPRDELVWNNKGSALYRVGRLEEALACYDGALKINPRYESAWSNKGVVLNDWGRSKEAMTCYDRALKINSRFEKAWYNKGVVLADLGRPEEALACYDDALKINPRLEPAWYNKGFALYELGRLKEALPCYDHALEVDPRHEGAWLNKGVALDKLGRWQEALICYNHALAINPRHGEAWFNKGSVLFLSVQRYREALACFEQAQRIGITRAAQAIVLCQQKLGNRL